MDTSTFKQFFLPCSRRLYGVAFHLTHNVQEAEDFVQETLLKLWMCRERLGKMNNAEAYSIAVLRNLFKERYRKSDPLIPDVSPEYLPLISEDDIGKRIEQSEASDQVKQLIVHLPLQQRQIITMHDLEERSYDEIAGLTGFTVNNIRVLLSRARKTIRQQFRI